MTEKIITEKLAASQRPAVLGVGSVLKGDDAAGMLLAEKLKGRAPTAMLVMAGSTAPENFTGVIKEYSPDTLFIVDAAKMGQKAGQIQLIDTTDIAGATFSTHMLPLPLMLDYLKAETGCAVVCIGIEPKTTEFGVEVCAEVNEAVERLYDLFTKTNE